MKTFSISITITGKVTVPDDTLRDLRIAANDEPGDQGGDPRLHALHLAYPTDDDSFLRGALTNGLRNVARNGIVTDISNMGVGARCAPPVVTVSVPEYVVTKVKAREQIGVDRISVADRVRNAADAAQ